MSNKKEIIENVRAFNRFYTSLIGLLDNHLLNSDYSLAEARILYEIYTGEGISASQIMSTLSIDKGYLSRILKKLEKDKLITKKLSASDARVSLITLTNAGLKVFNELNNASNEQIDLLIYKLSLSEQEQLMEHMQAIRLILKDSKLEKY